MKYALHLLTVIFVGGFIQAQAEPATEYLIPVSNIVAYGYSQTADSDLPKTHALLGKALADFNKPSTNAAGDFNIFLAVATHLLQFEGKPLQHEIAVSAHAADALALVGQLGTTLSNTFYSGFVVEALAEIEATSNRVAQLNDFQKLKRPAGVQVGLAGRALNTLLHTSNVQIGMLSLRLAFTKLTVANRLAATAELHPGKAWNADEVVGASLDHTENNGSGTVIFNDSENMTEREPGKEDKLGTYTYDRTGLDTAKLVLQEGGSTTVALKFLTHTNGTFTFVHTATGEATERGKGTFSISK